MLGTGGYIHTFLGSVGVESVGGGWLYTFLGNVGVECVGGGPVWHVRAARDGGSRRHGAGGGVARGRSGCRRDGRLGAVACSKDKKAHVRNRISQKAGDCFTTAVNELVSSHSRRIFFEITVMYWLIFG